ncbi:hypothetical protein GINT2_001502 [Glugoides intestinalis]
METMVSTSNNIEQVISVWQDLIWSKQPGALLSTKSLIVISIVIFLIMTLLYKKYGYYYNLLSFKMTILLTIISGIIFGKGVEILFRTLHIIWSGAYGNVVFSLADIFISLLFGSSLVCFGSLLLFNKKLHKRLRLQKSEYAKLKEIMDIFKQNMAEYKKKGTDKGTIIVEIKQIVACVQKIMGITKLKGFWKQEMIDDLKRKVNLLEQTVNIPEETCILNGLVSFFKKRVRDLEEIVDRPKEMLNYLEKENVGRPEEMLNYLEKENIAIIEELRHGLKAIVDRLEAYIDIKVAEETEIKVAEETEIKAAEDAEIKAAEDAEIKAAEEAEEAEEAQLKALVDYLELKMVNYLKKNLAKLGLKLDDKEAMVGEIDEKVTKLRLTVDELKENLAYFEKKESRLQEKKDKIKVKVFYKLKKIGYTYKVKVCRLSGKVLDFTTILYGLKKNLANLSRAAQEPDIKVAEETEIKAAEDAEETEIKAAEEAEEAELKQAQLKALVDYLELKMVNYLKKNLAKLGLKLDDKEAMVGEIKEKVAKIGLTVYELKENLAKLGLKLDELENKVVYFEKKVYRLEKKMYKLKEIGHIHKEKVDKLSKKVLEFKAILYGLKENVAKLKAAEAAERRAAEEV